MNWIEQHNQRLADINSKRFQPPRKEKILIFKGGGYDGCIWEWNALFFEAGRPDEKQPFVTGYKGKDVIQTLNSSKYGGKPYIRKLLEDDDSFLIRSWWQWLEFCREYNAGFVRKVARHAPFEIPCEECKMLTSPNEIFHWSYKGDGGVGISYSGLFCYDCIYKKHQEEADKYWPRLSTKEKRKALKAWRKYNDIETKPNQIPDAHYFYGEPEFY